MKKYISLITLMFLLIMALTGCGGSDSSDGDNTSGNIITDPSEKIVQVNPNGSLDMYTQSGMSVRALENTFDPNVRIKITENKVSESMSSDFSNISNLFTISAKKIENTALGETTTDVKSVEKPIIIKIPNNSMKEGIYYLGTRAYSGQPWKYTLLNSSPTFLS